jgi:uncharacterized protein YjbI with pentapeptide repeats
MNRMEVKEIKNLDGETILSYDENDERWIDGKYDLSGKNLERANLEGIIWMEVTLRDANLKEANFYWANLFMSDLSEADGEGAKFYGTNLESVNFTKANLKNAVFGKDDLDGATNVCGANFTDAVLDGAKFDETLYDRRTIFPKNFNPDENGLVRIKNKYF